MNEHADSSFTQSLHNSLLDWQFTCISYISRLKLLLLLLVSAKWLCSSHKEWVHGSTRYIVGRSCSPQSSVWDTAITVE